MRPIRTLEDLNDASDAEVEQVKKQVTVQEDLIKYLRWLNSEKGGLVEGTFTLGFRPRTVGIHPSSIAKRDCLLKIYFDATGEVEPKKVFDANMQLIYDVGTLIHAMLQLHFLH